MHRCLSVLAVLLAVLTTDARASSADDRHLSLNGDWRFALPEAKAAGDWDTLPVPGNWNCFTDYADHVGDGWYERDVSVPAGWAGKRVYLKFDAVYDIADVWLDGAYLGQHTGGYTPFEFDVTGQIEIGAEATVTVKANNEHKLGAWFQWGGISRGVSLVCRDDVRLIRQKIEPVVDLSTGASRVKLRVVVENKGGADHAVEVAGVIDGVDGGFRMAGTVPAGATRELEQTVTLTAAQTRLWHFDDPQLYELHTTLLHGGAAVDKLSDRFGVRSVEIRPEGMFLNGEKVRLMGYNRVHDHRAYGNVEPMHLVRSDIDLMKRSGANFSRLMHAPLAPELMDYCDEVGYLLWAEIPMWQTVYRVPMNSREDAQLAPSRFPGDTMREMIARDANHPSVIGWSPGNELRGEAHHYVEAMRPLVKELDPTRLYANIHDQGFHEDARGGFKGVGSENVDLLFTNKYRDDDAKLKAVLDQHASIPDLPIFMSEFGGARDESLGHTQDFAALWERLGKEPYLIGGALWTFNDYRSYFKLTPASQNRDWGVVDIWRNPKRFYHDMARLNQPVGDLSVAVDDDGAVLTIVPRRPDEIPSFTLRGYRLVHEWLDAEGRVLGGAVHALDTIEPGGDAVLTRADGGDASARLLVASLVTPTGFTVVETRFDLRSAAPVAPPAAPEPRDPDVRKVLPLDGGFMVGVTSQEGDRGLEVAYGSGAGGFEHTLAAPVMGAIRVRGLANGVPVHGRVRRLIAEGKGPWSDAFEVVPDGGLAPAAPHVFGAVVGSGCKAVRLREAEKLRGFRIELNDGGSVVIQRSRPGLLIVPDSAVRLAAVGPGGVSAFVPLP